MRASRGGKDGFPIDVRGFVPCTALKKRIAGIKLSFWHDSRDKENGFDYVAAGISVFSALPKTKLKAVELAAEEIVRLAKEFYEDMQDELCGIALSSGRNRHKKGADFYLYLSA